MAFFNRPNRLSELENIQQVRYYALAIIIFLASAYSTYLLFDQEEVRQLGLVDEDGPFEQLTAIFFVLASAFLLKAYLSGRNIFVLLLAIAMFLGAGEEISWGQRILGFKTPEPIRELNVQGEFSLHNLEIFNTKTFDKQEKTGFAKLLTINFLYKLFWLGFGVLLPIAFAYVQPVSRLAQRLRLPIPPLSIGGFFLINWLMFRFIIEISTTGGEDRLYRIVEVMEACSAFLFMMLSLFFLTNGSTRYVAESRGTKGSPNGTSN